MVAPSSFEVEYCALMQGTKKILWLRKLLSEIKHLKPRSTIVTILVVLKLPKILFFMPLPNISNVITTSWAEKVFRNRHTTHPKYSSTSQHSYEAIRQNKI
jgi:hypothetical protein